MNNVFSPLERQVIVLAATNERECEGLAPAEADRGWLAALFGRIFPAARLRPLANARLETLRRLTCACFGSRGRPDRKTVRAALEAGLDREQIATLRGLARRHLRKA